MATAEQNSIINQLLDPVSECLTPEVARRIAELRAEAGRTGPFEITTPSALGATLDAVRRYEDVGVTRLSLGPPFRRGMTVEDMTDFLAKTGDEIIAKV